MKILKVFSAVISERKKMLHSLIFTCLLLKASASHISGYGNTTADYGGEAHYRCAVAIPTGVLQVTWQRLFKDESIENLATYSKRFGQQVNEPYRGKVIFTEASLNSTSITLKNVSWEDESCYICSFNVYPDGSKRKQTCLTVKGISADNAIYAIRSGPEKEDKEVEFSCTATGKPAPTIEWEISPGTTQLDQSQTATVMNSDQTFTTSHNITLQVPPDWNGHVYCLLNKGMRGHRKKEILFSSGSGPPPKKDGLSPPVLAVMITVLLISCCFAVAAVIMRRRGLKPKMKVKYEVEEGLACEQTS
ncbi:OX-2 membrane glycoprotein-like isoform X2 [Toxotes jaculatrix]|uniref:OX-2 membrane glycoprotein-like isoform X2 n=1 Tax=Toxotes jaculatrix TaxID=941984 RepID=UPI001B3AE74C|nr:OX-2 membrane glycoprotein-like isoform X2 [Toxotes jaculatrix]